MSIAFLRKQHREVLRTVSFRNWNERTGKGTVREENKKTRSRNVSHDRNATEGQVNHRVIASEQNSARLGGIRGTAKEPTAFPLLTVLAFAATFSYGFREKSRLSGSPAVVVNQRQPWVSTVTRWNPPFRRAANLQYSSDTRDVTQAAIRYLAA